MVRSKQEPAHYSWTEQDIISLKGEEKKEELFQVQLGPDGKPQKTNLGMRVDPTASYLGIVNTFLNPNWGIHIRDTASNSLTRLKNVRERAAEALGKIDDAKLMEIFDLTLFTDDGSFREKGGPTKPTVQDVDLTNHQIVTDLNALQVSQGGLAPYRSQNVVRRVRSGIVERA